MSCRITGLGSAFARAGFTLFWLFSTAGCDTFQRIPPPAAESQPASQPVADTSADTPFDDTSFTLTKVGEKDDTELRPARAMMVLGVLSVQIPEKSSAAASRIWEHVREEMLDAETRLRLSDNGFRAGIGHVKHWEPIRAVLDGIAGHKVVQTVPLRVPAGFPLALELDTEPRVQTLFHVGKDGVLRGGTFPSSRNALRVAYGPDVRRAERIRMGICPEVQQKQEGWRWVRTEEGLWQVPRQETNPFEDVTFEVSLARDEFLLIAPSESARLRGLIGRAMFTTEFEGTSYFTYVFLRPEVPDVGQRD